MPLMGWPRFIDAHHRPYLIRAVLEPKGAQNRYESLTTLLRVFGMRGNYAMSPDETVIRVAFQFETDAVRVARALNARRQERADEWAAYWEFKLTAAAGATIRALLPKFKRAPSVRKPKRKLPR